MDCGSGSGRAVIAAALLLDLRRCVGVEILQDLHDQAMATANRLAEMQTDVGHNGVRSVELRCANFFSIDGLLVGADVVFCCCVTWEYAIMHRLAQKLATELEQGAKVLTVGKPLPATATGCGAGGRTVRFVETWHGLADCEWGREPMVLHEVVD